ncbi:MAG: hypothetical protein U9R75_11950 [Candidatus Thermoplasmatota archaeon]|nr:hypothetical protein [Candidatus Thermoplasmatota archaeon]
MKRAAMVLLEGKEIEASVEDDLILVDGKGYPVSSAALVKRRKEKTFKVIVTLVVIILLGSLTYLLFQYLLGSEDQSEPYLELDDTNALDMKLNRIYPSSSLFLEGDVFIDLSDDVKYDMKDGMDIFTVEENVTGHLSLNIIWRGDIDDLMIKGISVLELEIDSSSRYVLGSLSFLVLDDVNEIKEEVGFGLDRELVSKGRTGSSTYTIRMDKGDMGSARLEQSGEYSKDRGCRITINFPDGIAEGEHGIKVSFGPDYYHKNTTWDMFIGAIVGLVTLMVVIFVFFDLTREETALIIRTDEKELVLFGKEKDLSALNYEISKKTISRMREEEKSDEDSVQKEFKIDPEEKKRMREEMKNLPGRPNRIMIQQCPECGSNELYYESGFLTGYVYHCKDCDYIGSFIIEKELDFED